MKSKTTFILATTISIFLAAPFTQGAEKKKNKAVPAVMAAPSIRTESTQLPETIITQEALNYSASEASTGAKIDVPLRDIPASIQVVPQAVLRDRGVTKIEQVAETVSGVHAESSYGNNGATFFNIRGFTASDSLRDGFRNFGYDAFRDVQSIDHIEVLKGPSSVLYGSASSLGGHLNTFTKRPQRTAFGEAGITLGSFGMVRPTLDWNLPLTPDGTLAMRLNFACEHNDTFRDHAGYESFSVASAIKWAINPDTSLTLLLEYDRLNREGFDLGVPNVPGYKSISRTRYFGLDSDYGKNDTYSTTLLFEHKLSEQWKWREGFHYTYALQRSGQTFPDMESYAGGSVVNYITYPHVSDEHSRDIALQSELVGKFHTGSLKHNMVFGMEVARTSKGSASSDTSSLSFDIFDPTVPMTLTPASSSTAGSQQVDDLGIYVQDLVEITPQLKLLGGARVDWFNAKASSGGALSSESNESHVSPRAGIVWQPVKTTSLYFGYSKAFASVVGHNATGQTYKAEGGEQFEIGIKQDIIPDRLTANLAAYHLQRTGVLTTDPSDLLNQIQTGEQRSRGIEFDLAGQITPAWKVTAAYAYTDAQVTSDNNLPVGDRLSNVPMHSANLWTTYQFHDGPLKGFGVGAGVTCVGEREANLPNTYKLDAYCRFDAALFYEREKWRAQVNFSNIGNTRYYTGGQAGVFNATLDPGKPFTVQATVSYKF